MTWSATDLTAAPSTDGSPLLSVRAQWKADAKELKGCMGGNSLTLLSVVGPIVSYREETGGECQGTVPPWARTRLVSVDTSRGGSQGNLTDWFGEADLLKALLADKRVQEALNSGRPGSPPTTLRRLLERIVGYQAEDCRWGFDTELLSHFALFGVDRDRVAVRIGLSHGCEIARGSFTLMNLALPMSPRLRNALDLAGRQQEGLLMQDSLRLFGKKRTVWNFPEEMDPASPEAATAATTPLRSAKWAAAAFAALSPDGKLGVTTSGDPTVHVWDLATGAETRAFSRDSGSFRSLTVGTDGQRAAGGLSDGSAVVWTLADGKEVLRVQGHRDEVWAVALSADGQSLLTGGGDRLLKLWDVTTGQEVRAFTGHGGYVRAAAFVPGQPWIVSASTDRTIRLWDAPSGRQLRVMSGHKGSIWTLAVSPDGEKVLSGADDHTVRLWDLATGKERGIFRGHDDSPRHVVFSPSGALAASADETVVRLWNVTTGKDLGILTRTEVPISALRFTADGKSILVGSDDGVQVWRSPEVR